LGSEELSADEVIAVVTSATTEGELRAAIHLAATLLRTQSADDKLVAAMADMMGRVEAAGIQFGRPHEGSGAT
jgi:hypothetical protein